MRSFRVYLSSVLIVTLTVSCIAQTKTDYSDKDKKKMAEIAERPDVKQHIEQEWRNQQRLDMMYAYNVNTASMTGGIMAVDLAVRAQYGQLYDNPVLTRYVNALGQKLVPANSPNFYSFKLLLDPRPSAEALTTGTIYVSTGLVSLMDNEAQLAYVLAHEISHVERGHQYAQIRNAILEEELDKEKEKDAQKKRTMIAGLTAVAGGLAGGLASGSATTGLLSAFGGYAAGAIAAHYIVRNHFQPTEWPVEYENEADDAGLKLMLQQNYDAREVPRLYTQLDGVVAKENRAGLGFIGSPERTHERSAEVQRLLSTTYKPELEKKLSTSGLLGSSSEFELLMASLKRDNGIEAMKYDMFAVARVNLEEASQIRSNDARTYYYLGYVLSLTGRTADDKTQAISDFTKAIKLDEQRGANPEPHLQYALYLISQNDPKAQQQALSELKTYVALYQRDHGGGLPQNIYMIYDFLTLSGDATYFTAPAMSVSTNGIDPLFVNSGPAPAISAPEYLKRVLGGSTAPATAADVGAPAHVKSTAVKKTETSAQSH